MTTKTALHLYEFYSWTGGQCTVHSRAVPACLRPASVQSACVHIPPGQTLAPGLYCTAVQSLVYSAGYDGMDGWTTYSSWLVLVSPQQDTNYSYHREYYADYCLPSDHS